MEEKLKRSDRRYRSKIAVKRRIKNWLFFDIHVIKNYHFTEEVITSNAEKEKCVLDGRMYQFLRTTGSPCNCWMCSGEFKYRTHKAKEKMNLLKQLKDLEYYEEA